MSLKWRYLPAVPDCDCRVIAVCEDKSTGRWYIPNYFVDYFKSGIRYENQKETHFGFFENVKAWMRVPEPGSLSNRKGWNFPYNGDSDPEESKTYLVTVRDKLGHLHVKMGYFSVDRLKWTWGLDGEVIAWREIPKYKEAKK